MSDTDVPKKKYEISYLLRNDADLADLRRLLIQHEAEVVFENPPRKIVLAYDIEHVKEAYFGFVGFAAVPEKAKRLEEDLRTNQKVLRSLIIDLSKEKGFTKEAAKPAVSRPVQQRSAAPRPEALRRPAPTPAISNEALEKKIEEILK